MAGITVNIQPEILNWALRQTKEECIGEALISNIQQWLEGTKTPTFNQIEELSRKSCIPLGYFFLKTPPQEEINLIEYRTVDSMELAEPSRNLIDTIAEMESIQDWMTAYRQEMGYDKCDFWCLANECKEANTIAEAIRKYLEISMDWYKKTKSTRESFAFWRDRLSDAGVIVMMNGIVKNNTRRALNIDEFRAFAMADEWAPLIFVNAADREGARLFSLLHEAAHICIGKNDFFNDHQSKIQTVSGCETLCNAVAAELLVPNKEFVQIWEKSERNKTYFEKCQEISKLFHCGTIVIARRALDNGFIKKTIYDEIATQVIAIYKKNKLEKTAGGNFYNTMRSRLDRNFVRAICESIATGRTSYTEAFRLTNTNKKTFFLEKTCNCL